MNAQYKRKRNPPGFMFLDAQATKRLQSSNREAQQVLENAGFERVMPASIDYPETFTNIQGRRFQFRDANGADLNLRNDVTVQVIKGYSNQLEESEQQIRKFFYTVPVFSDEEGQLREVYQVGAEYIGENEEKSIPELIELSYKILTGAFNRNPMIIISDIRNFTILSKHVYSEFLKENVRKKNAPELASLFIEKGYTAAVAGELSRALLYSSLLPGETSWSQLEELGKKVTNEQKSFVEEILASLEKLTDLARKMQKLNIPVVCEPLKIRKADYYSGFLFEGYIEGLSFSPLRGGAYDNLVEEYSQRKMNASGFALDATSLVV